ncbi:glycosyltransferase [Phaeobacter sp.]|uniref:glycosyltransferase n=1 Tax=Phaeobacter sp. TaxID=1902409 RepID=UPI0025EE9976|nr:glycosyltransferase [Phaeobacter sp.]
MARIVGFGSDLTDVAQLRRMASFHDLGHHVVSVTSRKGAIPETDWLNIDLGEIAQHGLLRRGKLALAAALRDKRLPALVRSADLIVARNLDMLALAAILRARCHAAVPLAYEVLDIHPLLEGKGPVSKTARLVERRLMKAADVLWVSSPGFVDGYFHPVQGYTGQIHLIENKLVLPPQTRRPGPGALAPTKRPIRLGWVGAIRCRPSFELLLDTVTQFTGEVELHIHGQIHDHVLPDFHQRIAGLSHVHFHGPYSYPDGLMGCYADCDVVWAQDLWQAHGNSHQLLPNRIYEAAWHNCPVIAVETTQTGRKIRETGQGWTIPTATPAALASLMRTLTAEVLQQKRCAIAELDEGLFRQQARDVERLLMSAGVVSGDTEQR